MWKNKRKVTWTINRDEDFERASPSRSRIKVKIKNPYPSSKYLGIMKLVFSFGIVWVDQTFREVGCYRCIRITLAVLIPIFLIYGVLFTTASLLKVFHSSLWSGLLPYETNITEFYWGLAIVGIVLIIVSAYGIYGIYGKRVWSSRVFAITSYIYGQASMTVSVSWLLLVQLESSDSFQYKGQLHLDQYISAENDKLLPRNPEGQISHTSLRDNPFLIFILEIVFFQSLFFIFTGVWTAVLIIRDSSKKGFVELQP